MRKKIVWMLLLISIVTSTGIATVRAPPIAPWLYVYPKETWDDTLEVGDEFSVDIKVTWIFPEHYLWAYQIELSFNPAAIHGVSYEDGPFLGSAGGSVTFWPGAGFDNTEGTLALFGANLPIEGPYPSGFDGVLATITFEVVAEGASDIIIGPASGLVDATGRLITLARSVDGFFCNLAAGEGPELYIRKRGAHGGGAWPEWHVGLCGEDQTLYARIMNYGELGTTIEVRFEVSSPGMATEEYTTDPASIDAATWVADDIVPGEVVVSVTFPTEIPAECTVNGKLYFKFGGIKWVFYSELEEFLGGEGSTRDVATKYKVVTQM